MRRDDTVDDIDVTALTDQEAYKLLTGVVIPRPIALVSSIDEHGTTNLAPFSFFAVVSHSPALLAISGANTVGEKDTTRNIQATGQFVVSIPSRDLLDAVDICGMSYPPGEDEFTLSGLTQLPARRVGPPLVGEAPVNLECQLSSETALPSARYTLLIGEVLHAHVSSDLRNERGHVDAVALDPLSRLGGRQYCGITQPVPGRPAAPSSARPAKKGASV